MALLQNLWVNRPLYRKEEKRSLEGERSLPDFAASLLATGGSLPPPGPR